MLGFLSRYVSAMQDIGTVCSCMHMDISTKKCATNFMRNCALSYPINSIRHCAACCVCTYRPLKCCFSSLILVSTCSQLNMTYVHLATMWMQSVVVSLQALTIGSYGTMATLHAEIALIAELCAVCYRWTMRALNCVIRVRSSLEASCSTSLSVYYVQCSTQGITLMLHRMLTRSNGMHSLQPTHICNLFMMLPANWSRRNIFILCS